MGECDDQQFAKSAYRHVTKTGYGGGKRAGAQHERVPSQSISRMTKHRPGQNSYRRRGSEDNANLLSLQAALLKQCWQKR